VAVCWDPPRGIYASMPHLRLVHSVAAGVDNLVEDQDLRGLPLCRVVDPQQARGMLQYVLWSTLYFHRRFDQARSSQAKSHWVRPVPAPTEDFRIGVMGLGEIGSQVARGLAEFGYSVSGWKRTQAELDGIDTFAGNAQLPDFLADLQLLVCLLPLTAQTEGLLNRQTFEALPRGASLVHCGRGPQLVEPDLLAALDSGRLNGAVLDVFSVEPLPEHSALWSHPRVVVTPHMATVPVFDVSVRQILDNVSRLEAGDYLTGCVDPTRGY
jgi:glyoxylate/hydroxypyruvate reductase